MEKYDPQKARQFLATVTKNRRKAAVTLLAGNQARIALLAICDGLDVDTALEIAVSFPEKKS